jgi:hypothetical protein
MEEPPSHRLPLESEGFGFPLEIDFAQTRAPSNQTGPGRDSCIRWERPNLLWSNQTDSIRTDKWDIDRVWAHPNGRLPEESTTRGRFDGEYRELRARVPNKASKRNDDKDLLPLHRFLLQGKWGTRRHRRRHGCGCGEAHRCWFLESS